MNDLSELNLQKLLVPMVILVALIIVGFIGAKIAYNRISFLNLDHKDAMIVNSQLTQKLEVLTAFEFTAASVASRVSVAIPQENPGVLGISQIKDSASTFGVIPQKISVEKALADESELSYINLSFETNGTLASTLSFLQSLRATAPLGEVSNINLAGSGESFDAEVNYKIYFSGYPESISDVTETINEFSPEELELIQVLTSLIPPQAAAEFIPNSPSSRINPFGI